MSSAVQRVCLVTGGNKGIGYFIVQQIAAGDKSMTVLLGARDAAKGDAAVKQLNQPNVKSIVIDIDDHASVQAAAEQVKKEYGGLDVLVNNAGMAFKGDAFDENVVVRTFKTNHYGTLDAIQTFKPLLRRGGKVINVSSMVSVSTLRKMSEANRKRALAADTIDEVTQLLEDFRTAVKEGNYKEKGWPESAYGMSKVGVSLMTRVFAKEFAKDGVTVNSGCPGWCKTDMAGDKAPRTAEEGARNFSHIALLPSSETPTGEFWEDSKVSSLTREQ